MVHRRGKTDDISCRLSSAKCAGRKDTHAIEQQRKSSRRQNQNRIRIDVGAAQAGAREIERGPLFVLSRGTGKEEQKKLDKVIIRGKGGEGRALGSALAAAI